MSDLVFSFLLLRIPTYPLVLSHLVALVIVLGNC